ncbi:peptidase S10, serine carboxypeptidase, Alpha/Beta hydrolase fold protein [Artemisia annua]|uniref:Peptidase S10, serine carboxypeptidase, Alpha/Beta hydrolase fold protein n=1 Tax=Artemisia annua TaxID=35608 RepID=A0A2U1LS62_ARTAN|nr:peptidase S10, serine carboxypeptidase, Alpha/Beta hydrolase fold protein [Artemisia annua]
MGPKCILVPFLIIFLRFITLSNSKSIVTNLPGFNGDLPFTLETGYIGVGEDEQDQQVQFFYYFVESQRNPSKDPVLFYLTGGPGTSALYPFLYQIGPLSFDFERSWRGNITLELNPYSWTKVANVIFIDTPAGVGFSYAKTWEASRSSDSILALHSYEFLIKWFLEHPRFYSNPLYITGVSYLGILVPIVALETYNGNERENQPKLNIKGCLMVSPLTDKFIDFNSRLEFAHRLALISDDIYESTKKTCHGNYVYNDMDNILCLKNLQRVDECTSEINLLNILEPLCNATNMEPTCREATNIFLNVWANDKDVQRALNIREGTIGRWESSNTSIHYKLKKSDTIYYSYDVFSSIAYHKQLLTRNCRVLIIWCNLSHKTNSNFSGDHDMTFPYVGAKIWIATLNLPLDSPWEAWFVRTQVAGYKMKYAQSGCNLSHKTNSNFSGDHDMTFPYVGAKIWIATLNLPLDSPWEAWFVRTQVAGYKMKYAQSGYSLTYATIKV